MADAAGVGNADEVDGRGGREDGRKWETLGSSWAWKEGARVGAARPPLI